MTLQNNGQLFSRKYLKPENLLQDDKKFRIRLGSFVSNNISADHTPLRNYIKVEGGFTVHYGVSGPDYERFFSELNISDALDSITLVWQFLQSKRGSSYRSYPYEQQAEIWRVFVERVFREEHLGYRVDEKCLVHYFVDEEFEHTRKSVISSLTAPRYGAVKEAFDKAHSYLDMQPQDTKASVRSAFEAVEILVKLMIPEAQNLNKGMIEKRLKPLVLVHASTPTDRQMQEKLLDSLGFFVDSIHLYRHGQGVDDPIAPPIDIAIYVLSSIASVLRWMAAIDNKRT